MASDNVLIRLAEHTDKSEILSVIGSDPAYKWDMAIAKRYYDDYFLGACSLKEDNVYVLLCNGNVVGVSGYSVDRYETGNYWLGWFYVHKDYKRKGYGKKLLEYVERELREKKIGKLFVDTSSAFSYRPALRFYIDYGFRMEAVIKDYYGKGEDQLILSKAIGLR